MREALRLLIASVLWFTLLYLDLTFVGSKIWTSQADNMLFVVDFEALVISNLTFLFLFLTLKE